MGVQKEERGKSMAGTDQGRKGAERIIEVVGGIIRRGDKYLLGKRPTGKSLGGHWEFIGGKIEPGETPCEALARECREEIALEIANERIRTAVTHAYPARHQEQTRRLK